MKKGVLDIHLMKKPMLDCDHGEKAMYYNDFGNKSKCLLIINVFSLSEASSHKAGFVPFNSSISMLLNFINPFATDWMMAMRKRNQSPCIIV